MVGYEQLMDGGGGGGGVVATPQQGGKRGNKARWLWAYGLSALCARVHVEVQSIYSHSRLENHVNTMQVQVKNSYRQYNDR